MQRGGPEASAFTQAALDRKTVELVTDPEGDDSDRYDRLLRYVYLDGKNFNATLIREGYATAIRQFPYSRKREFLALEAQARQAPNSSSAYCTNLARACPKTTKHLCVGYTKQPIRGTPELSTSSAATNHL